MRGGRCRRDGRGRTGVYLVVGGRASAPQPLQLGGTVLDREADDEEGLSRVVKPEQTSEVEPRKTADQASFPDRVNRWLSSERSACTERASL